MGRFGLKIAMWLIFMKIWQSEQIKHANYEYINWNWWPWLKTRNCRNLVRKLRCAPIFMKFWHLEQIERADYEHSTWNWWSWSNIIDSGKFSPSTESFPYFFESWHLQQIEHAYYEYYTSQCLAHSYDYRLRMIVGSKL